MKKKFSAPAFIAVLFVSIFSIGITGMIYIAEIPFFNDTEQTSYAATSNESRFKGLQVEILKDPKNSQKTITFQIENKDLVSSIKKISGEAPSCIKCHQPGKVTGQ